jgi:hypothetical protein
MNGDDRALAIMLGFALMAGIVLMLLLIAG